MPRNTREWAHRKLDMSVNNLDQALYHLLQVMTTYEELHPEIATPIDTVMTAISMLQETIKQLGATF